jgi:hypothetical protein
MALYSRVDSIVRFATHSWRKAAERALGMYATTQALLHLVHALWIEAGI